MLDMTYLSGWGPEDCGGQGCPGAGAPADVAQCWDVQLLCGHLGACVCVHRTVQSEGPGPLGPNASVPFSRQWAHRISWEWRLSLPPGRQWAFLAALTAI